MARTSECRFAECILAVYINQTEFHRKNRQRTAGLYANSAGHLITHKTDPQFLFYFPAASTQLRIASITVRIPSFSSCATARMVGTNLILELAGIFRIPHHLCRTQLPAPPIRRC